MGKVKSNKGITLISLVIVIIILSIIVTVTTVVSIDNIKETEISNFNNDLLTVQKKVEIISKEMDLGSTAYDSVGIPYSNLVYEDKEKVYRIFINEQIDKSKFNEYKFLYANDLSKIGLYNNNEYLVNFENAHVLNITGLKTDEVTNHSKIDESIEDKLIVDGSFYNGVNTPTFGVDMLPVAWNGTTEFTPTTTSEWYNYEVQLGDTINGGTSNWANAKTPDGSYWVWIPRYEYKINGETHNPPISVNFIPTSQTTATLGYTIHPAFINDSDEGYNNGGWDKELPGIWVMKFEASLESNGVHNASLSESTTNNDLADSLKPSSKPSVTSWRAITIGDMYTQGYNYDRHMESHLMKNSEWGAIAYLGQSQYGRNITEVTKNNSSSYITGSAGNEILAEEDVGTKRWNTTAGVLASTTGNMYGVYDVSGGAYDRVAAGLSTANADGLDLTTGSTKYKTAYTTNNIKGDAVHETSGWFNDNKVFPITSNPYFTRGGVYNGQGTGLFRYGGGNVSGGVTTSFRLVLCID